MNIHICWHSQRIVSGMHGYHFRGSVNMTAKLNFYNTHKPQPKWSILLTMKSVYSVSNENCIAENYETDVKQERCNLYDVSVKFKDQGEYKNTPGVTSLK